MIKVPLALAIPLEYNIPQRSIAPSIAVVAHMFYEDLFALYKTALLNIPFPCNLYLATDAEEKSSQLLKLFADWTGNVEVRVVPNRGRDIAPKLVGFGHVYSDYEYVLHLHTKKQVREHGLEGWRDHLLQHLLGSRKIVEGIIHTFDTIPSLGIVAGTHFPAVKRWIGWGENKSIAEGLASRMAIDISEVTAINFPAGSMFWMRPAAIKPLLDLQLSLTDFPDERGQMDGTTAHAIERLYYIVCEDAGYSWLKVTTSRFADSFRPANAFQMRWAIGAPVREIYRPSTLRGRLKEMRLGAIRLLTGSQVP